MDLNRLTRDADDLIRKVVSRYNQIYVPTGTISQLELDLMLDDLRKLYDTFKRIGQINLALLNSLDKPEIKLNTTFRGEPKPTDTSFYAQAEKPEAAPESSTSATQTENQIHPESKTRAIDKPDSGNDISYDKNSEFLTEPDDEVGAAEDEPVKPANTTMEKEAFVPAIPEANTSGIIPESAPATLADKFNTGSKSLSETIAPPEAQAAVGARLQFQPIPDLVSGISINDKFSFISELFGNNSAQYDEAIHRINKAVNLDEANWILQKYHTAEWEQKHETLARMKDFLKRRFI